MTARNLRLAFLLAITMLLIAPITAIRAEDTPPPEIENAKFQAVGSINSNAVYIRSGPSENDYPTMKLDRDQKVTAVGVRGDWLKIVPPEGSYCYVAKAYVEKRGDGTVGRVTNGLNVRVGSALNAMKTKVAAKLDNGDDVTILGEQDEYFKIAPPKDVYLYVNKQFVELVSTAKAGDAAKPGPTGAAPAPAPNSTESQAVNTQTPAQDQTHIPVPPAAPDNTAQAPADQSQSPAPSQDATASATTQPSDSAQVIAHPHHQAGRRTGGCGNSV